MDPFYDYDNAAMVAAACDEASTTEGAPAELDPSRFAAFATTPSEIDEETLGQLVAIIDGKTDATPKPPSSTLKPAPATIDRLLNSDTVVYITDNGLPVAVATIIDPTQKSYLGFKPIEQYSLASGVNLDGMLQQEFFAVSDQYRNMDIGKELRAQIAALGLHTFILSATDDTETAKGLLSNGYELAAVLPDDGTGNPANLWIG